MRITLESIPLVPNHNIKLKEKKKEKKRNMEDMEQKKKKKITFMTSPR